MYSTWSVLYPLKINTSSSNVKIKTTHFKRHVHVPDNQGSAKLKKQLTWLGFHVFPLLFALFLFRMYFAPHDCFGLGQSTWSKFFFSSSTALLPHLFFSSSVLVIIRSGVNQPNKAQEFWPLSLVRRIPFSCWYWLIDRPQTWLKWIINMRISGKHFASFLGNVLRRGDGRWSDFWRG
jgi:hypothetical protein